MGMLRASKSAVEELRQIGTFDCQQVAIRLIKASEVHLSIAQQARPTLQAMRGAEISPLRA
jgi:hypothetical protein